MLPPLTGRGTLSLLVFVPANHFKRQMFLSKNSTMPTSDPILLECRKCQSEFALNVNILARSLVVDL